MGRGNAAACYRELGAEMRRLREAAGLTGRSIARKTKWDPTRVSRIESGQINIDVADLCWYLGILRVDRDVALPLIDLCRQAKGDNGFWLSQHGEWVQDTLSSLIYHESTANASVHYEPQVVPGLLQTEGYARALIGREAWRSAAEVDASVGIRLERHGTLGRLGCRFVFYIHEHALHLQVSSQAVMYEQMVALTLVAAAPNVDIHVIPTSAGERSVLGEAFGLFEFEDHNPLVHLDLVATTLWLEDPAYLKPYRSLLNGLADIALGTEESRSSIAALADKYERGSLRNAITQLEEE
jgi:transcriptional regulator with XRE-family HTH domain